MNKRDIGVCGVGLILVRLKNCSVAAMKNFAMCRVYVILCEVYGEVRKFCGFMILDSTKMFLFT